MGTLFLISLSSVNRLPCLEMLCCGCVWANFRDQLRLSWSICTWNHSHGYCYLFLKAKHFFVKKIGRCPNSFNSCIGSHYGALYCSEDQGSYSFSLYSNETLPDSLPAAHIYHLQYESVKLLSDLKEIDNIFYYFVK